LEKSTDRFDKERGKELVLKGLFWQTLLAFVLLFVDTVVAYHQRSEITALGCEGIALERIMAPRVLAPSRLNRRTPMRGSERKFIADLNPYAGKRIEVRIQSAHDFDAENIADDLKFLLPRPNWESKNTDQTESYFAPTEIRGGITVYYISPQRNNPAAELAQALYDGFVDAGLGLHLHLWVMPPQAGVAGPRFDLGPSDNRQFVYVAIGPRPMGEQLAELKEHSQSPCDWLKKYGAP
jgi:hypothetical protein